jgi:hypothetical protein
MGVAALHARLLQPPPLQIWQQVSRSELRMMEPIISAINVVISIYSQKMTLGTFIYVCACPIYL